MGKSIQSKIVILIVSIILFIGGLQLSISYNDIKTTGNLVSEETLLWKLKGDLISINNLFIEEFGTITHRDSALYDIKGDVIGANHNFVDNFTENYGITATIFSKSNEDFIRVSTNILNKNGQRAIKSFLGKTSADINLYKRKLHISVQR